MVSCKVTTGKWILLIVIFTSLHLKSHHTIILKLHVGSFCLHATQHLTTFHGISYQVNFFWPIKSLHSKLWSICYVQLCNYWGSQLGVNQYIDTCLSGDIRYIILTIRLLIVRLEVQNSKLASNRKRTNFEIIQQRKSTMLPNVICVLTSWKTNITVHHQWHLNNFLKVIFSQKSFISFAFRTFISITCYLIIHYQTISFWFENPYPGVLSHLKPEEI